MLLPLSNCCSWQPGKTVSGARGGRSWVALQLLETGPPHTFLPFMASLQRKKEEQGDMYWGQGSIEKRCPQILQSL